MKINKTAPILFLILSVLGFLDALYLTVEHFLGKIPPCTITGGGCSTVLTSNWSSAFGVPIALLGVLYYFGMFVMTVVYLKTKNTKIMLVAAVGTVAGLLADVWFVGLQLFVIKQICLYCMISAVLSTILFFVGLFIFLNSKRNNVVQEIAE